MSGREEAIRQIHAAIADRTTCTLEDYRRATIDWVVVPIQDKGQIVGGVLIRHNELHVAVTRTPDASSRSIIRRVLQHAVRTYGNAVTTVYQNNARGLKFCRRLGFEITWQDEEAIQLQCTRCNHA